MDNLLDDIEWEAYKTAQYGGNTAAIENIKKILTTARKEVNRIDYKKCQNCGEMSDFVNSIGCRHCLY